VLSGLAESMVQVVDALLSALVHGSEGSRRYASEACNPAVARL
jgi:hypothetical protein